MREIKTVPEFYRRITVGSIILFQKRKEDVGDNALMKFYKVTSKCCYSKTYLFDGDFNHMRNIRKPEIDPSDDWVRTYDTPAFKSYKVFLLSSKETIEADKKIFATSL
jgi:hypothetical protein